MRLLDVLRVDPLLASLSRIRVTPLPGVTTVTLHYSGGTHGAPADGDPASGRFGKPLPPDRPRPADEPAPARPVITLMEWDALPDREAHVETADLVGQLEELRASGLVGGLNVERLGDGLVISTHAETQEERSTWLRALVLAPVPENVKPFADARKGARQ